MKYVNLVLLSCLFSILQSNKLEAFSFRDSQDVPIIKSAAQDQMEAGTVQNRVITPSHQQYHPSAAKGWVMFQGTATVTINASYNVSSITDNGTGDYTVNWTTPFSSVNYTAVCSAFEDLLLYHVNCYVFDSDGLQKSSTRVALIRDDTSPSVYIDSEQVHVVTYGDQ